MATQDISIARAVFTTSLLRVEASAPQISRDDATVFAKKLLRTLNLCTASDVKVCKSFIIKNILPSGTRSAALAKYLVILAKASPPRAAGELVDIMKICDENEGIGRIIKGKPAKSPDPAFRRVHALYILHDVFMHVYGRLRDDMHRDQVNINFAAIEEHLKPCAFTLAELAACGGNLKGSGGLASRTTAAKTVLACVKKLIDVWHAPPLSFIDNTIVAELHTNVDAAAIIEFDALLDKHEKLRIDQYEEERRKKEEATKWILPMNHGVAANPNAPWYQLPATNGMVVKRMRGHPMTPVGLPKGGFSVKHGGEQCPESEKKKIRGLLVEVGGFWASPYANPDDVFDIDALGNIHWTDKRRKRRNQYGWSRGFLEAEKEKPVEERSRQGPPTAPSIGSFGRPYGGANMERRHY